MIQLQNLTNAPDQLVTLTMPDGSSGSLEIIYLGAPQRWIYNLTHPSLPAGAINGANICAHPNLLRQFKNIIDFGLACVTTTGLDPVNLTDFTTGIASLYILDASDVQTVESTIFASS